MAPYPALYSVEAVIWPSVIFLLSIPRGSEHAMHREDVVISRDYSASLNSIVLHDYCVKDLQFGCLLQGSIFIFFIRVVSRASKPDGILARLQFGLPGQMCRTMKKIAIKRLGT